MKAFLLALSLLIAGASGALAQTHYDITSKQPIPGVAPIFIYKSTGAFQALTAGNLASAVGVTYYAGTTVLEICVEGTGGVRYTDDGTTTPTGSVGMLIAAPSASIPFSRILSSARSIWNR